MTNKVSVAVTCRFYPSCKYNWIGLVFHRYIGVIIRVVHAFIRKPDITCYEWLSVYRVIISLLYEKKLM